jgi:hypothetical protein
MAPFDNVKTTHSNATHPVPAPGSLSWEFSENTATHVWTSTEPTLKEAASSPPEPDLLMTWPIPTSGPELRVHGDPDPLPVGLWLYKTPHLIGLSFQPSHHYVGWMTWDPDMEVIGAGSKAFHHNVQKPRQTDTHGTADRTQRDALTQQVFNHGALLVPDATVFGRGHKRALARVTLMILLRMAGMAIFLVPDRSTLWARFSDDHSCW